MKRKQLYTLWCVVCLLSLSLFARGQTAISIFGDTSVCKGDTATYSVAHTPHIIYLWNTTVQGNMSTPGSSSVLVTWLGTGIGTVYVYGVDSTTGDTVQVGTLAVDVHPLPNPYITSSASVGCQSLSWDTAKDGQKQSIPPTVLTDTSGCINVCDHSQVTYYANDIAGSHFGWSVSGAITVTPMGDSCIVKWGSVGSGSITLIDTNAHGCIGTVTICFNIIARPKAQFYTLADSTYNNDTTFNFITVCLGDNVEFVDQSTGSITSPIMNCSWNFGDMHYMTTGSPTSVNHTYTTPGTYTVALVVSNACNCKDTAYVKVNVLPQQGVLITCPGVVCDGATAGYRVHNYGSCGTFKWIAKGGTIVSPMPYTDSITVIWNNVDTSGFGYLEFDATGCGGTCPGVTIVKIPVIQNIGHISGPKLICPVGHYIYRMPQWPTTDFVWHITSSGGSTLSYTDQRNEVVVNSGSPETIILTCTYQNTMLGCGGLAKDTIVINPPISLTGPTKVCYNSTDTWSLPSGYTGTWTLTYPDGSIVSSTGTNSFTATINQLGHYTFTVTGNFCGIDPLEFNVKPLPLAPTSINGPLKTCPNIATLYTATADIPGTIFAWNIVTGSADPVSGSDFTYAKFTGPGPWTVQAWHISMEDPQCISPITSLTVNPEVPNLSITGLDTVCSSTTHPYSVSYTNGEKYVWTVVPNSLGSVLTPDDGPNVNVTFNIPATSPGQVAKLIVAVTKCFVTYYDTLNVYVRKVPTVTVTGPDTICNKSIPTFTLNPSGLTYSTATWTWGDGNTSVIPGSPATASHFYNYDISGGANVTISVSIASPYGCAVTTTAAKNLWIKPSPIGLITPAGPIVVCSSMGPWNELLTATTNVGYGATANYAWYKYPSTLIISGAGVTSYNVTSAGLGYGTYYCIVTNSYGCMDTTNMVTIQDCTGPACGPSSTIPTLTVNATLDSCGRIHATGSWSPLSWGWFKDWLYPSNAYNVTTSSSDLHAQFPAAGNYTFTYEVKYLDNAGDTCVVIKQASAIVPYVAHLTHALTCTGSTYTLTLLDNSNLWPGTVLTHDFYINGGGPVYSGPGTSYTTIEAPGTYYLKENIYDGTHPICTAYDTVVIPNPPIASFIVGGPSPACQNDVSIHFTNTSTPVTGLNTLWNFGDGSSNTEFNVDKVYATPSTFTVSLTETNSFGCSSIATQNVHIVAEQLAGNLTHAPINACEGDPITITYNNTGLGLPTSYTWYNQTINMFTGTVNHITVFTPGGYWMFGTDGFGCKVKTNMDTVNVTLVPHPQIIGDTSQCINSSFTLNGFAGTAATIHYEWLRDGLIVPGAVSYELSQTFSVAGPHTYQLVIYVDNPAGGYCYDTSSPFHITVHNLPPNPSAFFNVLDCNTYELQLFANDVEPGTFTWSNGLSGTPVTVFQGGPYAVYFTDTFGCTSQQNLFVPKDPRVYLWVFPSGCFEVCKQALPFKLLGPSPYVTFAQWDWLRNSVVSLAGSGAVSSYSVTGPGRYNLVLNNGYCADTSDDMDLTIISCPTTCSGIRFSVVQIIHIPDSKGGCVDSLVINMVNSAWSPFASFTITANHGTILYGSGILPMGSLTERLRYIADPGFAGPTDSVTVTFTLPNGQVCTQTVVIKITPCPNSQAKMTDPGDDNSGMTIATSELAKLLLIPNPAQNSTAIQYTFTGNSSQRYIEVYDITGRLITKQQVQDASGSFKLSLDHYMPGIYEVVLRQDGQVFLQTKLSVIK